MSDPPPTADERGTTDHDIATAVVAALAAAGTRVLFGVPGGGSNLDVVGAATDAGLSFVLAHGETAATIMAATTADLTGAPGAVVVTRGPGLASAINGIGHAALDRLPVVVVTENVPAAAGRVRHQRLDQQALGGAVAKACVTVGRGQPRAAAARAVELATSPPAGPVMLTIDATDDGCLPHWTGVSADSGGHGPAASTDSATAVGADATATAAATARDLDRLAATLRHARRPALLLGSGAVPHTAAVRSAVVGTGIPVLHTYRARGIVPDTADEAAGLVTGGTTEWPLLAAADLIVGFCVDPVEFIPTPWDYPATVLVTEPGAGRSQEEGGYFTDARQLVAPVPTALAVLAEHGRGHGWTRTAGRLVRAHTSRMLCQASATASGSLSPHDVARIVREHAPAGTTATVDAGAHMLVAMPLWEVTEPRRLLVSSGLATMGFAVPAAIGAAVARPGEPVVVFTGDGGFGMTVMEVETAVRHRLPVVVVVFNDSALSLIEIKQRPVGHGGRDAVRYGPASFAGVAAALGAASSRVADADELASELKRAFDRAGPTVIDALVDPAGYPAVLDVSRGATGRRPLPGLVREEQERAQ